jgi:hypothetical protein
MRYAKKILATEGIFQGYLILHQKERGDAKPFTLNKHVREWLDQWEKYVMTMKV